MEIKVTEQLFCRPRQIIKTKITQKKLVLFNKITNLKKLVKHQIVTKPNISAEYVDSLRIFALVNNVYEYSATVRSWARAQCICLSITFYGRCFPLAYASVHSLL